MSDIQIYTYNIYIIISYISASLSNRILFLQLLISSFNEVHIYG